jgi:hypothetical protein
MDRTIRTYANFDEIKADEYRFWQSRPCMSGLTPPPSFR